MRQLIVSEFISLDGVIDSPGGGEYEHAGWTFKDVEFVPEAYRIKSTEQEETEALLLGRVSFTEFAPVWPTMDEFARYNEMPKYVVSTTLSESDVTGTGWRNCHLLRSLDDVAALRDGDGGPLLVHGSARLAQSLAAAGLVDRYVLLTFPIILGHGRRLFADNGQKASLTLVEHETYSNGIQLSVHDVTR